MFTIKEGTAPDKVGEGTPPEVLESISKYLEKTGHVVRTTDQEREYVKSQVQSEVDKAYSKHASTVDATVEEVTGIKKNPEEKTTDFLKRGITEKLKVVNDLQAQINEYKTKGIDSNSLAQELKKQNEQLQGLMQNKEKEWTEKITGLQTEVFSSKVNGNLEKAMSDIRPNLRTDLDQVFLNDGIAARLNKFHTENKASEVDGQILWKDPQGNTRIGKKDGKPLTTKEVLEPYIEDYIDKGKKGGGAGSGGAGGAGGAGAASWKTLTVPDSVKSKTELWSWLKKENKMDENSKDFNEAYTALGKDLPIQRN